MIRLRTRGGVFALILLLTAAGASIARLRGGLPVGLTLAKSSIELGVVAAGQRIERHVQFTNHSGDWLSLKSEFCCGIVATITPERVAPGASGDIHLYIEVPRTLGDTVKTVKILSQEREDISQELAIRYSVPPKWWPVPSEVDFGKVAEGSEVRSSMKIYYDPGASSLRAVESNDAQLKVEKTPGKPGDYEAVDITYRTPRNAHEAVETEFAVLTSDPAYPRLRIPVRAEITPCVTVSPAVLRLGALTLGSPVRRLLQLKGPASSMRVSVAEAPSWLNTRVVSQGAGKAVVEVTAQPDRAGVVGTELVLAVETHHSFHLPVRVVGLIEGSRQ